ncbi:retron Ec67 family RNA-directed DNA polymerase/endonuclease [Xanthobacter variabilis]|uniref:retron Ec67 family RNA-directed DNA polymerase/endonuclease n=1 Tax=Xanthobacter variabilis TaxID=3119932 RepID=UPI00372A5AC8
MSVLKSLKSAQNIDDFAALLGYKPKSLSYILYKIPADEKYKIFRIPKKSGGFREISAPTGRLKVLQKHLANVLYACRKEIDRESGMPSLSHGFRRGHSIVTNARPHHRRRFVLNLDLKDFFPSFNFGRVRGYFIKNRSFELNEKVATLIAQIACHNNGLPQGSPCSPIIADLLAHLLDVRLAQLAKTERVTYSRYADDITFSTNQKQFPVALAVQDPKDGGRWELGAALVSKITGAGFTINPGKTRMQCRISRQLVTGLIVNEKVNIRSEYYRHTRAMCDSLFKTGGYFINPPLGLAKRSGTEGAGADAAAPAVELSEVEQVTTKSLGPIGGRLAHIHYVKDQIDRRDEVDKRKNKTAFRKLYFKFLFYQNFATPDRPLILTEGKTDNVYLSLAVRHSPHFQPKLGQITPKGFVNSVRYFNHLNKIREVLELDGGSGNFKFFIMRYNEIMKSFSHRPQAHPVILLLDNDDGAKNIFATIKQNYGVEINHDACDGFYHVTDNLYLIKTPHVGKKKKTCIEDLFEPSLLKEEVAGKTLNLGTVNPDNEYGKHIFAEKVVRPKAATLKWGGFDPLLQRVSDVLDDYTPPS